MAQKCRFPQVAVAPNKSLLMNMRTRSGVRQFSWSLDGKGEQWCGKHRPFWSHFWHQSKTDHFTETGSGQTYRSRKSY